MYKFFIDSHLVISSLFFIISFILIGRMLFEFIRNGNYKKVDKKLSQLYLIVLYLQFITGVLLYFFISPNLSEQSATLEQIKENTELRFWVIEHLATMIFALMLSQIGWILIRNTSSHRKKIRNTLFYYGVSLIIIIVSTSIAMIKEGLI